MLIAFIGGILTGLNFIFPKIQFFCFLSFSIVFYQMMRIRKHKKAFFMMGFLNGLGLHMISMSFILKMYPLDFMGYSHTLSMVTVIGSYLFICLYEALFMGLFFLLFGILKRNSVADVILFPILHTLMEIFLSLGSFGLTFSHLYLTQFQNKELIQIAALFSSYSVTFFIVLINCLIAYSIKSKHKIIVIGIAVLLFSFNFIYGKVRISNFKDGSQTIRVSMIQGNISSTEKWGNNSMNTIFNTYMQLSCEALKDNPSILIWPETTIPVTSYENDDLYKKYSEFAKKNKITFIVGGFRYDMKTKLSYNSIFVFDQNGKEVTPSYHKRHLVPFGEYMPFGKNEISRGEQAQLIDLGFTKIGALICMDSSFPNLAYDTNQKDPDFFAVLSNDSWFKDSFGITNHNAHSIFRAIENKKYIARCANTGITNFISPTGEQLHVIPPLAGGYTTFDIPIN